MKAIKALIVGAITIAGVSCSQQTEHQVVRPSGSGDGWTHEATRQWQREVDFEKVGLYGSATGTGTAAPFSR